MKLLLDKIALITGGARGIGKSIVKKFAEHGAKVIFTYVSSQDKAKSLEEELGTKGFAVKAYRSDASHAEQVQALIDELVTQYGRIDVLVNNAGITRDNLLMRMSEKDWDDVIASNLKSVYNMTKAVQRTMLKQRAGSIINLSSIVGIRGNAGQTNYAASKAGIIGFTKSVALELGSRNIRCNVIAPGFIETEMTSGLDEKIINQWKESIPLKRIGSADDVANLALFLASEMSNYITGQVIQVDGGMYT